MTNQLKYIHLAGYKSIGSLEVEMTNLNLLIGCNGSGKSNFISAFRFLRQVVEKRLQVTVREEAGSEKLLHYGSKRTPFMYFELGFPPNYYSVKLLPSVDDSLFIEIESTGFQSAGYEMPYWKHIAVGSPESKLMDAAKNKGIPGHVYDVLKKWRVYHFHDTSSSAGVKKTNQLNDNLYLREDASNLAAFLYRMQHENPRHFHRIEKTVQLVVPMFREFLLRPDPNNPETTRLEWLSNDSDYILGAAALSDGSLRFMCLCTLLLQPERPDLILLDEPELGLHPLAIQILAGLFRKASHSAQLIISTQSPNLVSEFQAEDVIVVEHKEGASTFERLEKDKLKNWLDEYSLGDLWQKNVIGGRP